MKILWFSAAPTEGSGYGTQTALWTKWLRDQGHEVVISAYHGLSGKRTLWEGMTVLDAREGATNLASNFGKHVEEVKPDAAVYFTDAWLADSRLLDCGVPVYVWLPADTSPLSLGDTMFCHFAPDNVHIVAMSEAGKLAIETAGFKAAYVPHALDTELYRPAARRAELRAAFGIPETTFAIGINSSNVDAIRKGYPEQFWGFAEFAKKHETVLFVHSHLELKGSLSLPVITKTLGIDGIVRFADQERLRSGGYCTEDMVLWYAALDLVSNCSYGEGFGLVAIEAQACGTPVILSDGTTGRQLAGPGWTVKTEPFWNLIHGAWWHRPSTQGIRDGYIKAWESWRKSPFKRAACRQFAEQYDIRIVGPMWEEVLTGRSGV